MSRNHTGLEDLCQQTSDYVHPSKKPVEIYVFIDPLCPECWSLNPYLRKLSIEYGRFFTVSPIISGIYASFDQASYKQKGRKEFQKEWYLEQKDCNKSKFTCPWIAPLAIKAAEIQGKRAGKAFLQKMQQKLFLFRDDITKEEVLIEIATEAKLDVDEFKEDLYSTSAKKAFQCDFKLIQEMEIDYVPTAVFINHYTEEQGIKIAGIYPYEVYEHVLQEILQRIPIPSEKPPLEEFLRTNKMVDTEEISFIYNWPQTKTEIELRKLQFRQKVKQIEGKYTSLWLYND